MRKLLYTVLFATVLLTSVSAVSRSGKSDISRNLSTFNQVYKELILNYIDTLDGNQAMRTAIDAMLSQADPYTEYYSPEEQEEILSVSSGEYAGIGSVISKRDSVVVLVEPRWDSPARRAGVRHGDILLAINGEKVTGDVDIKKVSAKLKGQPGTEVKLDIRRPYVEDSLKTITIIRGTIKIDPVPYYGYIGDGVGYVNISTFNEHTADKVAEAVRSLIAKTEVKSLVLDLRENGGGILEGAVRIVGDFVPKGTNVVEVRYRDKGNNKTYKTTNHPITTEMPMAVLIDGGTASSAEILSGALQDLDRAVVIGERSYGKGLVQNVRPMPYDGLMKVTTGRYYIPSGRLIQAINYSHKSTDNASERIPDSLTTVFYTAAGRPVRDGGGITPDSVVKTPEMSRLMYKLLADDWINNYANRYANTHEAVPDPMKWKVSDEMFEEFVSGIDSVKFNYELPYDAGIKYLRDAARLEGYLTDSVEAQIKVLSSMLKPDLKRDLKIRHDDIKQEINRAIGQRYFSEADQIRRLLDSDSTIQVAKHILNSPGRYNTMLQGPANNAKAKKSASNKKKSGKDKKGTGK